MSHYGVVIVHKHSTLIYAIFLTKFFPHLFPPKSPCHRFTLTLKKPHGLKLLRIFCLSDHEEQIRASGSERVIKQEQGEMRALTGCQYNWIYVNKSGGNLNLMQRLFQFAQSTCTNLEISSYHPRPILVPLPFSKHSHFQEGEWCPTSNNWEKVFINSYISQEKMNPPLVMNGEMAPLWITAIFSRYRPLKWRSIKIVCFWTLTRFMNACNWSNSSPIRDMIFFFNTYQEIMDWCCIWWSGRWCQWIYWKLISIWELAKWK